MQIPNGVKFVRSNNDDDPRCNMTGQGMPRNE
jgi:hypothetical protein